MIEQDLRHLQPMAGRLIRESPANTDLRIIAVELTLTDESQGRTEELAMFPCYLTVADVYGPGGNRGLWRPLRANITLHTSEGDRGVQMPLR